MAKEQTVTLICECFFKVGPVKQVIPCTWQYKDDESCPEVPLSAQYDWECDPRDGPCKDGQYPPEEKEDPDGVNSTNPGGNPFSWTDQYNLGSNANPFASFPRPGGGGPIIISPVMTQTIGNINASGGPGSNLRPHSPADFNMNNYDGHTHQNGDHDEEPQTSTTATNNASEIQKKNLLIAETKEKLRSLKSLLRASKEGHKREKEQYEVLQKTAVESFQRERLAFARERDSIVGRYEAALQAKDAARQDTLDQLNKMQDLLHINIYHMDRSDSNGEQMEMDKSIPNVRDEQKFNGMQKVSTGKHRTEKGRLPEEQEELLVFNDDEPMSDRVNKIKNIRSDR